MRVGGKRRVMSGKITALVVHNNNKPRNVGTTNKVFFFPRTSDPSVASEVEPSTDACGAASASVSALSPYETAQVRWKRGEEGEGGGVTSAEDARRQPHADVLMFTVSVVGSGPMRSASEPRRALRKVDLPELNSPTTCSHPQERKLWHAVRV